MSRNREIEPTAPTHARIGAAAPQVKAAKLIKENYYRSAAWMTGYEWRQMDARERAAEAAGLRPPPKPVTYSWEDEAAAREYIDAQSARTRQVAAIKAQQAAAILQYNAEQDPTQLAALQQLQQQQQQQQQQSQQDGGFNYDESLRHPHALSHTADLTATRPANPIADALEASQSRASGGGVASPTGSQTGTFHSRSPFGDSYSRASDSELDASPPAAATQLSLQHDANGQRTLTLAGIPVNLRQQHPDAAAVASRLARAGVTGMTHSQQHTQFLHPVHSPPATEHLGGKKAREFNSGLALQKATFSLRGAGALPTHGETTRTSSVRLTAGVSGHHTQQVVDWSDWARSVEQKLAKAKGTLATGQRRGAGRAQ